MAKRDYYEVLEVTREVTEAELKLAFRKQAMKHHPDRNPGSKEAEARFKEVNEAYEALKDPQKRAAYDRFGHAAFEQGGMGGAGAGGFGGGGFGSFSDIFNDIFEDLAGRGRRGGGGGGRERGADLRYNMEIELEDAFNGKTATIKIPTSITCEACSGSGAKPGSKPKTCSTCAGHGPRARHPGLLFDRTHLPLLPGTRRGDRRSVPLMQWRRTLHARAHALGETFPPVSRTAHASASPMKVKPGREGGPPGLISISSCRSSRMSSSSAMGRTCIAGCRSRW